MITEEPVGLLRTAIPSVDPAEQVVARDEARRLLAAMPARTQAIVLARAAGATLEQIGREVGLTRERVRQLLSEAASPRCENDDCTSLAAVYGLCRTHAREQRGCLDLRHHKDVAKHEASACWLVPVRKQRPHPPARTAHPVRLPARARPAPACPACQGPRPDAARYCDDCRCTKVKNKNGRCGNRAETDGLCTYHAATTGLRHLHRNRTVASGLGCPRCRAKSRRTSRGGRTMRE